MPNIVNKDSNVVGSADWIREQARTLFQSHQNNVDYWMRDVLVNESAIIMERVAYNDTGADMVLLRSEFQISDNEITFTEPEEVGIEYVVKARAAEHDHTTELTGPIVGKSAAKRIAWAAVLVPGEEDSDGDVVSKEKIEEVAHSWLSQYGNVDLQHTLNNVATPVESYITHEDREVVVKGSPVVLPAGTWILASRIDDNDTWDKVVSGDLSGYSIMGVKKSLVATEEVNKSMNAALKRTTLKDFGDDWVAPFVSVVHEPAVPKAKFFALKEKERPTETTQTEKPSGFFSRLLKSKTMKDEDMNEEQVKRMIDQSREADQEVIKGLQQQAATLLDEVATLKQSTTPATEPEPDTKQEDEKTVDATEALKQRIDELEKKLDASTKSAEDHTDIDVLKEQAADFKAKLEEANKAIEKIELKRSPSRAIKGQEDSSVPDKKDEEPVFKDRDAYGRFRPNLNQ